MKKLFLALFLLTAVVPVMGQFRYCNSFEDYQAGRWTDLQVLYKIANSRSKQLWVGGNDFKFTTGDEKTDKILKKTAFVIEYGDTLYVNLRTLRHEKQRFGNGYAQGFRFDGDKIVFSSYRIGKDVKEKTTVIVGFGVAFGAIGGAIVGAIEGKSMLKDRMCYLIDNGGDGKTIDIKIIGDRLIRELLFDDHRDAYLHYMSVPEKQERESAANVLPVLLESGLAR